MKILLDARMVGENVHGIGRYTVDLIHGLKRKGCEISIIYDKPEAPAAFEPETITQVFHLPVKFASARESWSLSFINIRWDLHKFDIIHFPSFAVPMPWAPITWGKTVITIHDTIHLSQDRNLKHQAYYKLVVHGALQKARAVLAVSEWGKKEIIDQFQLRPDKVHVVRNGLEKSWFETSELAESSGPGISSPAFICVGNTKEHKNIQTLIEASRDLWNEGEDFKLQLALSGNDIPDQWGLSALEKEKITVLKNVSDDSLKRSMRQSRALISTSMIEGFNYPAAEALALGTPVILSQGSAQEELSGSLVHFYGPPRDKEALKKEMKKAIPAPRAASQPRHNVLTVEEMVEKTLLAYGKIRRM